MSVHSSGGSVAYSRLVTALDFAINMLQVRLPATALWGSDLGQVVTFCHQAVHFGTDIREVTLCNRQVSAGLTKGIVTVLRQPTDELIKRQRHGT